MGGYTQNTIRDPWGNILGYTTVTAERPYISLGVQYDPIDFPKITEEDYKRGYTMSGPDPNNPDAPYTPMKMEINRPVSQNYINLLNAYDYQHNANVSGSGTTYKPRAQINPDSYSGSNARSINLLVGENVDPYIKKKIDPNYDLQRGLLEGATKAIPKATYWAANKPQGNSTSIEGTYTRWEDFPTSSKATQKEPITQKEPVKQGLFSGGPVRFGGKSLNLPNTTSFINSLGTRNQSVSNFSANTNSYNPNNAASPPRNVSFDTSGIKNWWATNILKQGLFSGSPVRLGTSSLNLPNTTTFMRDMNLPTVVGAFGSKSKLKKLKPKKSQVHKGISESDILKDMGLIPKNSKKPKVKKPKKTPNVKFRGI